MKVEGQSCCTCLKELNRLLLGGQSYQRYASENTNNLMGDINEEDRLPFFRELFGTFLIEKVSRCLTFFLRISRIFATHVSTSVFAGLGPSISTATMNANFKDPSKSTWTIYFIMVHE